MRILLLLVVVVVVVVLLKSNSFTSVANILLMLDKRKKYNQIIIKHMHLGWRLRFFPHRPLYPAGALFNSAEKKPLPFSRSLTSLPPFTGTMAAVTPSESAQSLPTNVVIKTEPDTDDVPVSPADVPVRREPVVPLSSPVSGPQPAAWSQDHRLSVCSSSSLSLLELLSDVHSSKPDMTLHRTSIPVPAETRRVRVNNYRY